MIAPHASTDVSEAARAFLAAGFQVVPIPERSKSPGFDEWQKCRISPDEVATKFRPGSNLGLLLGDPSGGLVDVDLDCPEAVRIAGMVLPPTHMIHGRKSAPRSHYWYVVEGSTSTSQFRDPDGSMLVELRSTGGQTLVPPSVHPEGEELMWDAEGQPSRVALTDLLLAVRQFAAAVLLARRWTRGQRDASAMALAGGLLRAGWPVEEVEKFIRLIATAAQDEEVESRVRTVRDTQSKLAAGQPATGIPTLVELFGDNVVSRIGQWLSLTAGWDVDPRRWERPEPLVHTNRPAFPTLVLPPVLRQWVTAEAIATQTPEDLPGMLVLAACASAVARKVRVRGSESWTEPTNLFVLVVLQPANRKTSVFAHAVAPLEEFEMEQAERLAPTIAEVESRRRILSQELKQAEDAAAKGKPEEKRQLEANAESLARDLEAMEVPVAPRLIVDDCSPERLASILKEQRGRLAVLSAEGDVFELMAGRYSAKGMPNLGVYLKGHAGDTLTVDRVGRPADHVRFPALTIGLTVQPEVLRGLASVPQFRGRGLIARFLFAVPESPLGRRDVDPPSMPDAVASAYRQTILALLRLDPGTDSNDEPVTRDLRLSPTSRDQFLSFCKWMEPRLAETGDLGWMNDWAGKLSGAVLRIAGILHLVEHADHPSPWDLAIADTTITSAMVLGEYLIEHAKIAMGEMSADPELADAMYVLRHVEASGELEFSRREMFERTKGRLKTVSRLEVALGVLAEHGFVRALARPAPRGPGRPPGPSYEVNPFVFEQDDEGPAPDIANTASFAITTSGSRTSSSGDFANNADIATGVGGPE